MRLPSSIDEFLANALVSDHETPPVAVVDCDGTIIRGDIGEAMFYFQIQRFLFRESPARLWPDYPERQELDQVFRSLVQTPPDEGMNDGRLVTFANHLLDWYFGQLKAGETEKACSDIVRLLAGFTQAEIAEIARDTLNTELTSPRRGSLLGRFVLPHGIRFIRETVELLNRLQAAEFQIWVVSGSNVWSVREVCKRLPVSHERIAGIELLRSGELSLPRALHPIPVGHGKIELLKAKGIPPPHIVISDSIYDLPLFRYSTGMRVLIASTTGPDAFFRQAGLRPDPSWVVIENPTPTE
ncbi:MAG: haloacid dehalogenase-like hydrolase [Ignavibacteria bacterium]|nr:haloacid dehalogenase-like hydrolase [Ignavibacteria bacterium]